MAYEVDKLTWADLTLSRFRDDYQKPGRPFVLSDFADQSVADWDIAFLQKNLGDADYSVREYGVGHFDKPRREWSKYCDHLRMPFSEYAELLASGAAHRRRMYMAQNPIGGTQAAATIRGSFQQLSQRTGLEPIIPAADINVWIGPGGHTEPLHFDPGDSTLVQLHGEKKVALFAPEQTANLYPFGFYDTLPFWVSSVDVEKPELSVFPRLTQALDNKHEVVLKSGEMLYIPTHWWHEVTALGTDYVSSLNHFWKVRPFPRNFNSSRSAVLYFMNKLPWGAVLKFNRFIYQLKAKPAKT